jgi:hypothetical protein
MIEKKAKYLNKEKYLWYIEIYLHLNELKVIKKKKLIEEFKKFEPISSKDLIKEELNKESTKNNNIIDLLTRKFTGKQLIQIMKSTGVDSEIYEKRLKSLPNKSKLSKILIENISLSDLENFLYKFFNIKNLNDIQYDETKDYEINNKINERDSNEPKFKKKKIEPKDNPEDKIETKNINEKNNEIKEGNEYKENNEKMGNSNSIWYKDHKSNLIINYKVIWLMSYW